MKRSTKFALAAVAALGVAAVAVPVVAQQGQVRWRGAHGNDAYWAQRLGRQVACFGGRGLWETMTARAR